MRPDQAVQIIRTVLEHTGLPSPTAEQPHRTRHVGGQAFSTDGRVDLHDDTRSVTWRGHVIGLQAALDNRSRYRSEHGQLVGPGTVSLSDSITHVKWKEWMLDLEMVRGLASAEIKGQGPSGFKAFHRALCKSFDYAHDEVDWARDQVSLIEHIKRLIPVPPAGPPIAYAVHYPTGGRCSLEWADEESAHRPDRVRRVPLYARPPSSDSAHRAPDIAERDRFEAWMGREYPGKSLQVAGDLRYLKTEAQNLWDCWCTAAGYKNHSVPAQPDQSR
jgi:hypothetical protein